MGHTKEELKDIVGLTDEDAKYHLKILIAGKLVEKRGRVYHITEEGKRLMNQIGITEDLVKRLWKEVNQKEG